MDPGVGTDRRAVAASAGGHFLVGPDNGLLAPAIEWLGGADRAVEISDSRARLVPTSRTLTSCRIAVDGTEADLTLVETFAGAAPGEPLLLLDSSGHVALAVNGGHAATRFSLAPGREVVITPRTPGGDG